MAAIMKDYQRESWSSFDKLSIPGLLPGEDGIRAQSVKNVYDNIIGRKKN